MAKTARQGKGLRERKKERMRASIQAHALRLFRTQGYEATTVEQIRDAAEVSETTFFRYFPRKEELVLTDELDRLLVEAYLDVPPATPPLTGLREAFRTVFGSLSDAERADMRARVALIASVPGLRASILERLSRAMRLIAEAMAERTGRSPADFAVRTVAGAAVGSLLAVMDAQAEDPGADLGALIDAAFAHLESGLRL